MTPLEMIRSTPASGSGIASISASRSSTLGRPASCTARAVRSSISGRKSSAITLPVGPVRCAARIVSIPPPQPRSRMVSPGWMSA